MQDAIFGECLDGGYPEKRSPAASDAMVTPKMPDAIFGECPDGGYPEKTKSRYVGCHGCAETQEWSISLSRMTPRSNYRVHGSLPMLE
ncbi:MAG TPA: hypothetical protein VHQ21_07030, partial [Rhodanobacteraceae bacterium]|nr:hypothetical protein [Rhodanobacteraceae bacterium]